MFRLCFGEEANRSIYKAYYIKLEPTYVNNILHIPKYRYQIGIGHFLPKNIIIGSIAKKGY